MRTRTAATALSAAALAAAVLTTGAVSAAPLATASTASCTPTWKLVATPQPPPTGNLSSSGVAVVSNRDAWFPGWTQQAQGVTATWTSPNQYGTWSLHWNGHSLRVAPMAPQDPFVAPQKTQADGGFNGPHSGPTSSFDSSSDGWVLGGFNGAGFQDMLRWHAGRWTVTPLAADPDIAENPVTLLAVASLSPDDAWAVGEYDSLSRGGVIEHWDGTQWAVVPNPSSSHEGVLWAVSAVSAKDIWAVGSSHTANGPAPLAEHWNGATWSKVRVPGAAPKPLFAVSADGPRDVWAVGVRLLRGTSDEATGLVEHWNGTSWKIATGVRLGNTILTNVYAASPSDVWALVETVRTNTDFAVDEFLHWDGARWTTVQPPGSQQYNVNDNYIGISGSGPGDVWAAGTTSSLDQPDQPLIAHLSCGTVGR